jgi:hypothetical protein
MPSARPSGNNGSGLLLAFATAYSPEHPRSTPLPSSVFAGCSSSAASRSSSPPGAGDRRQHGEEEAFRPVPELPCLSPSSPAAHSWIIARRCPDRSPLPSLLGRPSSTSSFTSRVARPPRAPEALCHDQHLSARLALWDPAIMQPSRRSTVEEASTRAPWPGTRSCSWSRLALSPRQRPSFV